MWTMDRDQFSRVRKIFHAACDLEPDERRQFLEQICAGDRELADEVRSLLAIERELPDGDSDAPTAGRATFSDAADTMTAEQRGTARYRIEREIARGAFATVYLGYDTELKRSIAIKVPHPDAGLDMESYVREARTIAQLTHPGIVPVYDVVHRDDGTPWVVMMYVNGPSLQQVISAGVPSIHRSARLVYDVAEAVHHAHTQGYVHRDLKPSNLLLDHQGSVFVADFGLAIHEAHQEAYRGDASGTPLYRAPEQVRGEANWLDGRCDIWALGVILYELLVGRTPFSGEELNREILERQPKPPRMINDAIPASIERIVLRCLAKSPEQRYPTADALAADLRAALLSDALPNSDLAVRQDARGNALLEAESSVVVFDSDKRASADGTTLVQRNEGDGTLTTPNPFKGLAAFQEEDAHLFFGREEQLERLWNRFRSLYEMDKGASRFLPIIGPSGSGKSSLARAGFLADLARRSLGETRRTRVAIVTPGSHPIDTLANVLARIATGEAVPVAKAREFAEELALPNSSGRHEGLRRIAGLIPEIETSPLVLLIDQFEEVYSLCDATDERSVFIENLIDASTDSARHVSVVITLRSDFLGVTQSHPALNLLVAEGAFLVPAMGEDEIRKAIADPARCSGRPFSDSLVDLLVKDCAGREGSLPLLQFALRQIWDGMTQGIDPHRTLRKIGGVGGALAGEAQKIYERLEDRQRGIARRIFLSLVQLGEGTHDTRRRVPIETMIGHEESRTEVAAVLERFSTPDARLITLAATSHGVETAEVTHEALFSHWRTLAAWLDESREDLRFHRRLDEAAKHWSEVGHPDGLLWRSPDLDLLTEYFERAPGDLTSLQLKFFSRSQQREDNRQRRARWRVRFYQLTAATFGILLLLIGYLVVVALRNASDAQLANEVARKRMYRLQLVTAQQNIADGRKHRLAEWLEPEDRSGIPDLRGWEWYHTRALLHRELYSLRGHTATVRDTQISPDDRFLASGGDDRTVRIWDLQERALVGVLEGHESAVLSIAWSPDGRQLVSCDEGGYIFVSDRVDGMAPGPRRAHDGPASCVVWRPQGDLIASGGHDRIVTIWEGSTLNRVCDLDALTPVFATAWSPDGSYLAAAHGTDDAGTVEVSIWATSTWRRVRAIDDGAEEAWCLAWSPDGSSLAFGADLRRVKIAGMTGSRNLLRIEGHRDEVFGMQWSPVEPDLLASVGGDESIRIWNTATGTEEATFLGHSGAVHSLDWSADGKFIVTGGDYGEVKVWDPRRRASSSASRSFPNWVASVSWHPNNRWLATACLLPSGVPEGVDLARVPPSATIWDTQTGQTLFELRGHVHRVWSVAWSPSGTRLATASLDRSTKVWSDGGELLHSFDDHIRSVTGAYWSPDESFIASMDLGEVTIWRPDSGEEILRLSGAFNDRMRVAWSPDSEAVAFPDEKREDVCVYDVSSGSLRHRLSISHGRGIAWSPDGRWLAIGGFGDLHVWNMRTHEEVYRVTPHLNGVDAITWSPDSRRIATASSDGAIKIIEALTGTELLTLHEGSDHVATLAWSRDGYRVAGGTWGGKKNFVHVWDASRGYEFADKALRKEAGSPPATNDRPTAWLPPSNLVPLGSTWKYLDAGPYPGADWVSPTFDDSTWKFGAAPLGYGNGDEATVVEFGGDRHRKRVTTLFRLQFEVSDVGAIEDLTLGLVYDDGAAVYLNGVEIVRSGLSRYATLEDYASEQVDNETESEVRPFVGLDPSLLGEGQNLLAVEIHQQRRDSSDISFDLSLGTGAVRQLASELRTSVSSERLTTIRRLGTFGDAAGSAVPELVRLTENGDTEARLAAMNVLANIPSKAEQILPNLIRTLGESSQRVRREATDALCRLAMRSQAAAARIERYLDSDDPTTLATACRALGGSGRNCTPWAVRRLKSLTTHEDHRVRHWAIVFLSRCGEPVDTSTATDSALDARRHRQSVARILSQRCEAVLEASIPSPADLESALADAKAALQFDPNRATLHGLAGKILFENG